jgi:PadR family transcriptional regulator PadR
VQSGELSEWTSQLRRGVLELCILHLLQAGPSYGYEIVTRLDRLGPLSAGENTIYPLLRRLKAERLLDTTLRDSPAGPPRLYYRLTADGRARAVSLGDEWKAMVTGVAVCMDTGDKT